jgi:hypothetical protein
MFSIFLAMNVYFASEVQSIFCPNQSKTWYTISGEQYSSMRHKKHGSPDGSAMSWRTMICSSRSSHSYFVIPPWRWQMAAAITGGPKIKRD